MADVKQLYDGFGAATSIVTSRGPIDIDATDAPDGGDALVYNPATDKFDFAPPTGGGGATPSSAIKVGVTGVTGGATAGFLFKDPSGLVAVSDSPIIGPLRGVEFSDTPGYPGQICTDGTYIYICIGPTEWRRVLLETFATGYAGPGPTFGYLGLNLGNQSYYDSAFPMVNFWRTSRDWPVSSDADGDPYDTDEITAAVLDENGYPTVTVPYASGGYSNVVTYPAFNTGYPGLYIIDYDGTGTLSFINAPGAVTHPTSNQYRFTAATGDYDNQVFIRIMTSSLAPNNVRNIRVTAPCGSDDGIWNNDFINQMSGLGVIRAMETLRINDDDDTVDWADRFKRGGGAGDYAAIAEMGAKLMLPRVWITIPQKASDDYCEQAFTSMLPYISAVPDGLIMVEYGNEPWNGTFSFLSYLQTQGLAAGLDEVADFQNPEDGYEFWAGIKYYCRRSAEIWEIARTVIGDGALTNVKRVMGAQAGFSFIASQMVDYYNNATINPTSARPDVLAIAPYMGSDSPSWTGMTTVSEVHAALSASIAADVVPWVSDHQTIATTNSLALACYEAGSHLYGNPTLGTLFVDAVRHPGIQAIYEQYIDAIRANAAGDITICFFDACRRANPGDGSSWGVYETQSDNPATAYRMVAIKNKL